MPDHKKSSFWLPNIQHEMKAVEELQAKLNAVMEELDFKVFRPAQVGAPSAQVFFVTVFYAHPRNKTSKPLFLRPSTLSHRAHPTPYFWVLILPRSAGHSHDAESRFPVLGQMLRHARFPGRDAAVVRAKSNPPKKVPSLLLLTLTDDTYRVMKKTAWFSAGRPSRATNRQSRGSCRRFRAGCRGAWRRVRTGRRRLPRQIKPPSTSASASARCFIKRSWGSSGQSF